MTARIHTPCAHLLPRRLGILARLCAFLVLAAVAQAGERGYPLVRNFTPGDYRASPSIWSALATPEGTMLFGETDRLLEFDGIGWRSLEVPGAGQLRVLAAARDGSIWVAGNNELGLLRMGPDGRRHYQSLRAQIPAEAGNLGAIRHVHEAPDGFWIQCSRAILHLQGADFSQWLMDERQKVRTVWLDDTPLIANPAGWFKGAPGGIWERIGRPEDHLGDCQPMFALAFGSSRWLMALQTPDGEFLGLALFDGAQLTPAPSPLDDFFRRKRLTGAHRLADGRIVFTTALGGIALLNAQLANPQILDERAGLESANVNDACADARGGLWLATDWGISRVELTPAYTWFGPPLGWPRGGASSLCRWRSQLLLGGPGGVLKCSEPSDQSGAARFDGWTAVAGRVDQIIPGNDGELLAAGESGVWQLTAGEAHVLPGPAEASEVLCSRAHPGRLYAITSQGLAVWHRVAAGYAPDGLLAEPHGEMGGLVEDAGGTLWIGTSGQSVWRVSVGEERRDGLPEVRAVRLGVDAGLPAGFGRTRVVETGAGPLFITPKGLYRVDPATLHFHPEGAYGRRFTDGSWSIRAFAEDPAGGAWILAQPSTAEAAEAELQLGHAREGVWRSVPVPDISRLGGVERLVADSAAGRTLLWALGAAALLRIDLTALAAQPPRHPGPSRLSAMTLGDGRRLALGSAARLRLGTSDNTVRFTYSTPGLDGETAAWHETRLTGLGAGTPELSRAGERTYAGLPAGEYAFEVRGRTADGRWSHPARIEFLIPTPWWSTATAWTLYWLLGGAAIWGVVRWRLTSLTRERNRLEQIVAARTAELARTNAELRRINRREHDEKLAARLVGEKARLEMLRYQLNPHFLYNALNSIRALIFSNGIAAGEMVTRLSEFCRRTLSGNAEGLVPVADEVTMLRDYLAIEQARWQQGLVIHMDVAEAALPEVLPQFLLLPLVENAIKYGGRTSPGVLVIRLTIRFENDVLLCEVANTGHWITRRDSTAPESTGIGLENLRRRLNSYYGPGAVMESRERDGWVHVRLRLPRAMLLGSRAPMNSPAIPAPLLHP